MRTLCLTLAALGFLASAGFPAAAQEKAADQQRAGSAATYVSDDNFQRIFVRSAEGDLVELYHMPTGRDKGWHRNNLTAEANAPKAQGSPAAFFSKYGNSHHVFFCGTDGQIHELFRTKDSRWMHADLTTGLKTPKAAGDPTAYVKDDDKTLHVVFRTMDGDLCELYRASEGDRRWGVNNLTAATKAPKAAGDPCGSFVKQDSSQCVIFRSTEGQIQELRHTAKDGWLTKNLSAEAQAAKAAGDPFGYFKEDDKTHHIVFRTADGEIGELYRASKGDTKWGFNNLTTLTKAPKAAGDPIGYFVDKDDSQRVLYRGTDGQIQELCHTKKDGWLTKNLTGSAEAPKAAGDPIAYVKEKDNTQHVIFRSADGQIIELYRAAGDDRATWHRNNLSEAVKPR